MDYKIRGPGFYWSTDLSSSTDHACCVALGKLSHLLKSQWAQLYVGNDSTHLQMVMVRINGVVYVNQLT